MAAGGTSAAVLVELNAGLTGAVVVVVVLGTAAPMLARDMEGPIANDAPGRASLAAFNATGSTLHLSSISSHTKGTASNLLRCSGTGDLGSPAKRTAS